MAPKPVQISLVSVIGRILWTAAILALVGAYPTYRYTGRDGLAAMFVAGAIVVLVACLAAALLIRQARHGAVRLAVGFLFASTGKVLACVGLATASWYVWNPALPFAPLFTWVVLFYVVNLISQCVWLVKVLRQN